MRNDKPFFPIRYRWVGNLLTNKNFIIFSMPHCVTVTSDHKYRFISTNISAYCVYDDQPLISLYCKFLCIPNNNGAGFSTASLLIAQCL